MPDLRIIRVLAMVAGGEGRGAGLVKADIGEFTITRRRDWPTLELGFVRGWAMAVKHEGAALLAAWPADTDGVRAVGAISDPGDRLAVDLMKRQTFLYLSRASPRFAHMHLTLENAVRTRASVSVAVAPGKDLIEDLRLV